MATKMAVGPSAAPMMPTEAASVMVKTSPKKSMHMEMVKKIPNWAAAPKMQHLGVGQQRSEIDHGARYQ